MKTVILTIYLVNTAPIVHYEVYRSVDICHRTAPRIVEQYRRQGHRVQGFACQDRCLVNKTC